jgi:hypothetical protein
MNLEKEIAEKLAEQFQEHIDFEVMSGFLKDQGWHRFDLIVDSNKQAVDIALWVEENAQGQFYRNGTRYLFELEHDASRFVLKWML